MKLDIFRTVYNQPWHILKPWYIQYTFEKTKAYSELKTFNIKNTVYTKPWQPWHIIKVVPLFTLVNIPLYI